MNKLNLVLTIPEAGEVALVERPYPKVKPGYVIIKVEIAPVCLEGTRVYKSYGQEYHDNPKQGNGHEGVGVVDFAHPDSVFKVGDRVIVYQGDFCGHCYSCTHALSPSYCPQNFSDVRGHGGYAFDGIEKFNESESGGWGMQKYRIAPEANVQRIPDDLDFKYAATANCSVGAGFSAQELDGVKAGDWVLVGGIGFIGMGHVISAIYRGANVIALVRNEYREDMLRRMGVEHFVDPGDDDWLEQIVSLTPNGEGVDYSSDGSGHPFYIEKLMQALRPYGRFNHAGFIPDAVNKYDIEKDFMYKSIFISGHYDVRRMDRDHLVRCLQNKEVQRMIDVLVTHQFPMTEAEEAFKVQISKQCGKVYLFPQK